ncbi:MAG: hypothetical protein GY803_08645 [Chloroflexi bacterium]|nr:hypothetical protein [Chloroflexota bacterium]
MKRNAELQSLNRVILGGFTAVALALIFWSAVRPGILAREDNPRLVEAELRIQRGQILDRNGVVLAETTGPPERQQRHYPLPHIGPAVGYYSFRHGTAGVEESYDVVLRGDSDDFWAEFVRRTLHRPQVGRDVQLTLDAGLQETAVTLMNDRPGAILLLDITGPAADIRALVSQPGYDPNQLDDLFDDLTADENAPLLNRVTQGQYQPGLILQPFILAAALEQGLIRMTESVANANRPVPINGVVTRCASPPPEPTTWADALTYHCPGPMQDLSDQLGIAGLDQIFSDFGLTTPPQLALDTEAPPGEPLSDPLLAGIGQENLTATPLQIGLAWAALAGNGLPTARLIADKTINQPTNQPISRTARPIRDALTQFENISEYSQLVLSGPEGSVNGWYLGLTTNYAIVVVVEGSDDLTATEEIGRGVMAATLMAALIP